MRRVSVWLWLFIAFVGPGIGIDRAAAAPSDLNGVFEDIENAPAQMRQKDISVGPRLDRYIAFLSDLLDDRKLPVEGAILVRYYRAMALDYRNEFEYATRGQYDAKLTQRTLSEFDEVVARIDRQPADQAPQWKIYKGNALYFAGGIAYVQLKDILGAYRYWNACAAVDHAGCLNIVATALTTGEGGTAVDLSEALRMHKRVFDTAASYGCAGVISAYSVAVLVATGSVKNTKDNAEIWIENASNLLNVVEADAPGDDRCSRTDIQLAQYLIGLSHGKKKDTLLDTIMTRYPSRPESDIARYLKGDLDEAGLTTKAAGYSSGAKCRLFFYALWAADIGQNRARAKQFESLISADQDLSCRANLAYSRGFKSLQ